jgi:hypothetical protein
MVDASWAMRMCVLGSLSRLELGLRGRGKGEMDYNVVVVVGAGGRKGRR